MLADVISKNICLGYWGGGAVPHSREEMKS